MGSEMCIRDRSDVEDIIGKPPVVKHEPLKMAKYDLSKYGITDQ